jgi:hypothetical protein
MKDFKRGHNFGKTANFILTSVHQTRHLVISIKHCEAISFVGECLARPTLSVLRLLSDVDCANTSTEGS